jgi:hypothetical protein
MKALEPTQARRLRLDGDDACAEPPKRAHAIADVRAHVEAQAAGRDERRIQALKLPPAPRYPVINREGSRNA